MGREGGKGLRRGGGVGRLSSQMSQVEHTYKLAW